MQTFCIESFMDYGTQHTSETNHTTCHVKGLCHYQNYHQVTNHIGHFTIEGSAKAQQLQTPLHVVPKLLDSIKTF